MTAPHNPNQPRPLTANIHSVAFARPLTWLVLGWQDMRRCGWLSVAQGGLLAAFGAALLVLAHEKFWFLAGAFSGFLVVAPVLATSLYAMSRALEQQQPAGWLLLRSTWLSWQLSRFSDPTGYWCLVRFGLLLAMAGTGWVLTSAALITLLAPAPIHTPADFLLHIVLAKEHLVFELWLAMGGVLAAPIFASTVVAMPLMLDRRCTVLQAVLTSWRVVLANPAPMALWSGLIMLLVLVGFTTLLLGLVVVLPVLGHASWHAYRDLVDAQLLPLRTHDPGST